MFLFKCKKSYSAAAAKVGNMVGYFFENQCSWFCCSFFWKKREPISTAKPVTATVNKSRFVENIFARGCGCGRGRGCLVWGLPSLSTSLALLLNQREKQKHDRFVHIANKSSSYGWRTYENNDLQSSKLNEINFLFFFLPGWFCKRRRRTIAGTLVAILFAESYISITCRTQFCSISTYFLKSILKKSIL